MRELRNMIVALIMGLMLAGCTASGETIIETPTATASPEPTITPMPPSVWVEPGFPADLAESARSVLISQGFAEAAAPDGATVQLVSNPPQESPIRVERVYALVAPFPTIADDISGGDLQAYWIGSVSSLPGFETAPAFMVTQDVADLLAARWGTAGPAVRIVEGDALLQAAWDSRPAISMVPFDQLNAQWKVLSIGGVTPLNKTLDAAYPLRFEFGVAGNEEAGAAAVEGLKGAGWAATNRDPAKITIVVMTGVTAMTRATAWFMEMNGLDFPGLNIQPFFADADILHISNEVSFTPKCPPPELTGEEKFCSNPKYLDLLLGLGVDIIELTGNHNNDFGTAPSTFSLDSYDAEGIRYFGGGRNLEDAVAPRILTVPDGTTIGFVGCNSAGPFRAWANDLAPGAAPCDDWSRIRQTISDLKSSGQADIVIATVQYQELPYYAPSDQQRADFDALAAAGADIVSGSQAHQPMGFSFASGKFVHYGVGNLFFDQMAYVENRQMFADKYVLYDGKLASVILFTGMMEDYSQPRPMTPEERIAFLKRIFEASGW